MTNKTVVMQTQYFVYVHSVSVAGKMQDGKSVFAGKTAQFNTFVRNYVNDMQGILHNFLGILQLLIDFITPALVYEESITHNILWFLNNNTYAIFA